MRKDNGLMVIISGPSGAGKGTVVKRLLEVSDKIKLSVSATTRQPRTGERDGFEYYFLNRESFEEMIKNDEVLEYAEYCENYYGTPKSFVLDNMEQGNDVILEIEIQGRNQVVKKYPDCVSIFVVPRSFSELEKRLRGRGTEDESTINKRLETALKELQIAQEYDYIVINDNLDDCVNDILSILSSEKNKSDKRIKFIKDVFFNVQTIS